MKKIIFSLLIFCLVLPIVLNADGGIVPPQDYYMWETGQKGVIFYESDTKTESLVLSMSFQGNAKDFAWIIPTPNKPEVEQGSQDLFTSLEEITGGYDDYSYESGDLALGAKDAVEAAVTVIEQKTVDYYEVAVLSSTDADSLTTWLNDNGYQYPEKYSYIFNEYINNDWYFVAAKIIPELSEDSTITSDLSSGTATPLQLTFEAKNLVYPMKISQIMADQSIDSAAAIDGSLYYSPSYVDVNLYVITDNKQELTDFTVSYADEITGKEVQDLAVDTNGDAWVTPDENNYYLTKLYSYYAVSDMDSDLFPKDAEENTTVTYGYAWTGTDTLMIILYTILFIAIGIIVMIISPYGLMFIIFSLFFYFIKNVKAKIFFVVLQILDTIVTFLSLAAAVVLTVFAFILLYDAIGYYYTYSLDEEMAAVAGALALSVVLLLFFIGKVIALVIQKKKYKKLKEKK